MAALETNTTEGALRLAALVSTLHGSSGGQMISSYGMWAKSMNDFSSFTEGSC